MTDNIKLPVPPKVKQPKYATYIEGRSPKWKYHNNIGQAKNACTYMRRESRLYEIVGDQLIELYHVDPAKINSSRKVGGYTYRAWGPDYMPWNNTEEALKEKKRQEIRDKQALIVQAKARLERLMEELEELIEQE